MNLAIQVLWLAAALPLVAALALSLFGATHQRYAGWPWWLAALWTMAAGLVVAAWGSAWPIANLLAELLILPWPVLCLVGLRQFHARLQLPGSWRLDAGVLATAMLVTLLGTALSAVDSGPYALAPAAATLALQWYVAGVLLCAPSGSDVTALRLLGATLVACALFPVVWALPAWDAVPPLALRGVSAALGGLVLAFVVIVLNGERTERQLRDSRRRFRVLAHVDGLTKVPNRRRFHELASRVLAADPPGSAALAIFDVDHFKAVNDTLGHAAGDRALRLVAKCVLDVLRTNDVPGRYGGDEFVLLLRHANTAEAMAVANRIVNRVQAQAHGAGLPSMSLSFGMVHLHRAEALTDALRRADQALYEAKRQGRSRAVAAVGNEANPVFTDSERLGLTAI